tara:strand:+ start:191 stop:322 length:132 start_codon:yes stop_codon:yes gene_type:complete
MELITIIVGILICFGFLFIADLIKHYKQNQKNKDKLQDWRPHE